MFLLNLNSLETKYSNLQTKIEKFLKEAPDGHIKVVTKKGNIMFYHCSKGNSNGIYIQKEDAEGLKKIKELCQKKYYQALLPVIRNDSEALKKIKKYMDEKKISEVYDQMPECIKKYIKPEEISNEEYAKKWAMNSFSKSSMEIKNENYLTKKGEYVRSKSELIIADKLFDSNIPYRYEMIYNIPFYGEFIPDFTILNKRTKKIFVWEHFGLMSDSLYRTKALKKIAMYYEYESQTGAKLISTFEDEANPMRTQVIDAIIKNYLL